MFKQYRTFYNLLLVILLSTALVMVMYTYTVNISLDTVREDIQANNLNRLRFVVNNLDHNVEQLSMLAIALGTDSKVRLLPSIHMLDNYEQIKIIQDLTEKMKLQSFSSGWDNQLSIYSHLLSQWIGTISPGQSVPASEVADQWQLDTALGRFALYRPQQDYTISVTFPQSNLQVMLDQAKIDNSEPFFYHPSSQFIMNRYASHEEIVHGILTTLSPLLSEHNEGTEMITVDGIEYMVNYLQAETLGWYLIDYLPLNDALQPIVRTKSFFYIACVILALTGVVIMLFLYRKVQVPIITLLKGVRLLKRGDFSFRIKRKSNNEFDVLYDNFNDMAAQIEELIEKVYKEKIISREAMVKQLQSQINPHFLYNCLFFINNMTRLGNDEAVTAMTQNLAEYFRYLTRHDEPMTTLEKELSVVENYMTIQSLRLKRLAYEIDISDTMKRLKIPKLLLQPLVENSVIHGIEKKQSAKLVRITGIEEKQQYRLVVEDDGNGLTNEEILTLLDRLKQPLDDTLGCALWNIGQRVQIHFDSPAGMEIERSVLGGLRVTLYWTKNSSKED